MCMGRTHSLMSATLALACAAPLSEHLLHHSMPIATLFAFAGVTAGYGLLPDIDHPQATLARTLGPVTKAIAKVVHDLSGGHRKGTHTVWFAALMVGLATLLTDHFGKNAALPIAFIGFYLGLSILKLAPGHGTGKGEFIYVLEAAALTWATYHFIPDWYWLPYAVGFGVIGHILGDILTTEGVPIAYPLAKKFVVKVPLLGTTDGPREHFFFWLLGPTICWVALCTVVGQNWYHFSWAAHPAMWHVVAMR